MPSACLVRGSSCRSVPIRRILLRRVPLSVVLLPVRLLAVCLLPILLLLLPILVTIWLLLLLPVLLLPILLGLPVRLLAVVLLRLPILLGGSTARCVALPCVTVAAANILAVAASLRLLLLVMHLRLLLVCGGLLLLLLQSTEDGIIAGISRLWLLLLLLLLRLLPLVWCATSYLLPLLLLRPRGMSQLWLCISCCCASNSTRRSCSRHALAAAVQYRSPRGSSILRLLGLLHSSIVAAGQATATGSPNTGRLRCGCKWLLLLLLLGGRHGSPHCDTLAWGQA